MTTEQFEQAKPCPFCGEGATAEEFLKGCEHDGSFIPVHEVIRLMNAFAASQKQQPTAEGAEETAQRCPVCGGNGLVANGFYNQTSGYWSTSSISPETCRTCNGTGVILPSYLHAQQIADKMVSERLREELIKYDKYIGSREWIDNYEDWAAITSVDEYLKSRER